MSIKDISVHAKPTCDNDCSFLGWIEYLLDCYEYTLHVSVPPDTDLDDTFEAFSHDEQEMIVVNGWLFSAEQL